MRSQLTALLRKCKIDYTTHPGFVSIGNFHLFFDDVYETITIRTPLLPQCDYTIHYAHPDTVLHKYLTFKQFVKERGFYEISLQLTKDTTIGLS
jgi:hypothetical protein